MTRQEVRDLMASSKNVQEWEKNCGQVKAAFQDYPAYWNEDIIRSGLLARLTLQPTWIH